MGVLRRLRPLVKIQNDFFVFDTETGEKTESQMRYELCGRPEKFIFGVIYGWDHCVVINSLDEFKRELMKPIYKDKKMFAHNAEYDLNTLYDNIFFMDNEAIFNGSSFITATNGNCIFADSMNFMKTSVKKIGTMLGSEKHTLEGINEWKKIDNGIIPQKDIDYCIQDCKVVFEALFNIFEAGGDIKLTQASLSMAYFRRKHLPYDIKYNNFTYEFWNSYYGGRTEAFKIGATYASGVDVNSMYPFVMSTIDFPNPNHLKKLIRVKARDSYRYLSGYEGCITCTVAHKNNWFGLLPVRHEGKLIFPVGVFSGTWNFNELRYAISTGLVSILKVQSLVYAPSMNSIFSTYVEELYTARYATNYELDIYRIKIFMNSLYGKFAQRITSKNIYIDNYADKIDMIQYYQQSGKLIKTSTFNKDRCDLFIEVKNDSNYKISHSIPSFSSYITSGARVVMNKKLAISEKNKVVYCDTDSVFTEIGLPQCDSRVLGEWSTDGKILTEIRGLKNYSYELAGEIFRKIKGVPPKAKEILPNTWSYTTLIKTKEALRRSQDAGTQVVREKNIKGIYDKRQMLENGESIPLIMPFK